MEVNNKRKKDHRKWGIEVVIIAALIAIVVKIIWHWDKTADIISQILGTIYPFILGLLIAYIISPMVEFFNIKIFRRLFKIKHKKISKAMAVVISYLLVISLITTCMFYIIPQIVESLTQLSYFLETAQTGYNKIVMEVSALNDRYPEWNLDVVIGFIDDIPNYIEKYLGDFIVNILPKLYDTSVSLIKGVLNFLIAIIVSVYMLFDKAKLLNNIKKFVYAVLPEEKADRLLVVGGECNKIFGNFIIGKLIDSIIIGCMCWIIMTVVGIPYAMVISVIVGVTNMIPYFGPFIGAVPGILLLLIVDFYYALIFLIIIIVLQQFDGWYLGPKILGESTGLRPIWIIFAITVGGSIGGVAGMFFGVPVTAVIAYLLGEATDRKLEKKTIEFDENSETGIISKDLLITEDKNLEE